MPGPRSEAQAHQPERGVITTTGASDCNPSAQVRKVKSHRVDPTFAS
jgi:hypothetical protein